jgi:hypothetical protein
MPFCTKFGVVKRRPFQIKDNPWGRVFTTPNSVQKCVLEEKKGQSSFKSIAIYGAPLGVPVGVQLGL